MPIELPPLSRRGFLAGSLAAGAGLLAGRPLWAEQPAVNPHQWALFSDPHIAAALDTVHGEVNMADHLKQAVKEVMALEKRPVGMIVNGDCAFKDGEPGDYRAFVEMLRPIREAGTPISLTLGNHDDREQFWKAIPDARPKSPPLADRQACIVATERVNWFLLDSLLVTAKTPGELGKAQREWLADALDKNQDKPAIVMPHHQYAPPGSGHGLNDCVELFEILKPRKQVKCFIHGHTHQWEVTERDGLHVVGLPAVAYVFKQGFPSGWVQFDLRTDGATVRLNTLDHEHRWNGQTTELKWRA